MKEQILAALKTKFSNLGFTDKAFDGVATFGVTSVTDATQIEAFVNGVEPLLKAFQGDVDHRVNKLKIENDELKKKLPTEDSQPGKDVTAPTGGTETEKELLKTLAEMNKAFLALNAKVEGMETGATTQTWKQKLESALEKAPAVYKDNVLELFEAKTASFKTEEDFNTFLTAKVEGVNGFTKSLNEQGLGNLPKPNIAIPLKDGKTASGFGEMMRSATENKLASVSTETK